MSKGNKMLAVILQPFLLVRWTALRWGREPLGTGGREACISPCWVWEAEDCSQQEERRQNQYVKQQQSSSKNVTLNTPNCRCLDSHSVLNHFSHIVVQNMGTYSL
jgi:hypothetical protein